MTNHNFDPQRALEEGAVTKNGREVRILVIDANLYGGFQIVGIVLDEKPSAALRIWTINGKTHGDPNYDLKNKSRRETVSRYLRPGNPETDVTLWFEHCIRRGSSHRLDITLDDGVPVDAQIVDLREGE